MSIAESSDNMRSLELPSDEPVDSLRNDPEQAVDNNVESNNEELDTYKNNGDEGGRLYCWLSLVVAIVGAAVIVVMLLVVKDDDNDDKGGSTSTPPPSPTVAPTPAPVTEVSDPQKRLDILVEAVQNNPATLGYMASKPGFPEPQIPTSASKLVGSAANSGADPITRAASWVTRSDLYWSEPEIVERFVLAALFYTNAGLDWIESENWLTDVTYCDWHGVTCCNSFFSELDPHQCSEKAGHALVELDLHENNLQNEIPAAVSLLEDCHVLSLSGNGLTGGLDPVVFANMNSLDALYVQANRLSGHINGTIRGNGHLDTLYTHHNEFEGKWPASFCRTCVAEELCDHPPVTFSLDCDVVECPPACCSSDDGAHCVQGFDLGDDDDDDDDE